MKKPYQVVDIDWNTLGHLGVCLDPLLEPVVLSDILIGVEMEERLGVLLVVTGFWGDRRYAYVEIIEEED